MKVHWVGIARALTSGGTCFSQQVGPDSGHEIHDFFLGPQPLGRTGREPELVQTEAERVGLKAVDLQTVESRMEFFDVGAMVYSLRKVVWFARTSPSRGITTGWRCTGGSTRTAPSSPTLAASSSRRVNSRSVSRNVSPSQRIAVVGVSRVR